jgi:hypothetical protein
MKFLKPTQITDALLISTNVAEADYTAWSATTLYVAGDNVMVAGTTHKNYQALVGRKATVTMTIAAPGVVTWTGHALANDTPITFTTTGALPTGLTVGATYYAKVVTADTYQIAATAGGVAITTSGTQSGTHTCGLASGYNKSPATNPSSWVEMGSTNRWAMFDTSVGSQTSQATPLTVTIAPGIVNSLALLDLSATSVTVAMTDGAAGPTVFNQTYTMADAAEILDWYGYYFDPLQPQTELIVEGLPPYSAGRITVTVNAATTAKCGTLAVGGMIDLGSALYGVGVGITDYSRKETDTFGITSVVERSYAKRFDMPVIVENKRLDYLAKQLAAVRATPCVWIGDDDYSSLIAYGYYKDWSVSIAYQDISEMRLTVESLT